MTRSPTQRQLVDFSGALIEGDIQSLASLLAQQPSLALSPIGQLLPAASGFDFGSHDTALMVAVARGDLDSATLLLPFSNVLTPDHDGRTVLMKAAAGGNVACVQLVLAGSDQSALDFDGHNPLMFAASYGRLDCIRLLLPLYPDLHAVNAKGQTVLMIAATAKEQALECTRFLLPFSDARTLDQQGRSAFMHCVVQGDLDTATLLRPHSDVSGRDGDGSNVLHLAARYRPSMVECLLPEASAHSLDHKGQTPLMIASSKGALKTVRALLPHSDVAVQDQYGRTAFDLACQTHQWDNADVLARHSPFDLFIEGWARASFTAQQNLASTFSFMEQEQLRATLASASVASHAIGSSVSSESPPLDSTTGSRPSRHRRI